MGLTGDKINWLTQKLLPNGRAFRVAPGSELSEYTQTINLTSEQAYNDATGLLDAILPDNPNFSIDDAHAWYRRLGIYDSGTVPLSDMKLAISQKMSWATAPLEARSAAFIQQQLRAAGFDVYVHKNKFPDGMGGFKTQTPTAVLAASSIFYGVANHGLIQHGQTTHGGMSGGVTKIVTYIEEEKDKYFNVGDNYRSTFYIGGDFSTDMKLFTDVSVNRKNEFRQLILQLKAAHMCGFLLINYV